MQLDRLLRNRRFVRSLILAVLLVVATLASQYQRSYAPTDGAEGRPRLVDGDSFFLGETEVRMQGIDAPEGRQMCRKDGREWSCGEEAKRELQRQIAGRPIKCDVHSKDQHGRLLATCRAADGRNLNEAMVAAGYAVAFGDYQHEEAVARAEKRGIWASEFERPQAWRRQNGGRP